MKIFWAGLAVFACLATGCNHAGNSAAGPVLQGATHEIPLCSDKLVLKDFSTSDTVTCKGKFICDQRIWEWSSEQSQSEMADFYRKKLPNAKQTPDTNGSLVVTWTDFKGAKENEFVEFKIFPDHRLVVTESLNQGGHRPLQEAADGFPAGFQGHN